MIMTTPFRTPVIASFNESGDIKPLYVMIDRVQLEIVESHKIGEASGVQFHCKVADKESELYRNIKLSYMNFDHVWLVTAL